MNKDELLTRAEDQLTVSVDTPTAAAAKVTVVAEVKPSSNAADAEQAYQEAVKKYEEQVQAVKDLRKELLDTFQKSQDSFEKQLSYVAAGTLALSVGFIKDIVTPIKASHFKWMLIMGWILLIATLLINLISHKLAGKYARKGVSETSDIDKYDPNSINRRSTIVEWMNWSTVGSLTGGIVLIVAFIIINGLYDRGKKTSEQPRAVSTNTEIKVKDSSMEGPVTLLRSFADSSKSKQ